MRTRFRLGLSAFLLVLLAAACSDDDTSPTTAADDGTTTTTTTTSTTTTTTPAPEAMTAGDDLAVLRQLYAASALRTTYTFQAGGEETTVVLSQDPTREPPAEAVIIPDADAKLITLGDQTIFCDTHSNQCFEVPGGSGDGFSEGLLGPFAGGIFFTSGLDAIPGDVLTEEPREVAGRNGACFTFTPPASAGFDTGSVLQCVDVEFGFTLLIEARDTGSSTSDTVMELLEFGEPRDDDFTPTGPVTESP